MKRFLAVMAALVIATSASGHFAYIVRTADGKKIQVIFSDSLEPDTNVAIDKIAATTLFAVSETGQFTPMKLTKGDHALVADAPATGAVIIGGVTDYGFHQSKHTQNKPVWLKYYPKAIVGDVLAAEKVRLGDKAPLELVAVVREGKLGFQALLKGKPLPNAECGLLVPGEEKGMKMKTDGEGFIQGRFTKAGKYGARVAYIETTTGELSGKKYEEIRHYATLVVDFVPASGTSK